MNTNLFFFFFYYTLEEAVLLPLYVRRIRHTAVLSSKLCSLLATIHVRENLLWGKTLLPACLPPHLSDQLREPLALPAVADWLWDELGQWPGCLRAPCSGCWCTHGWSWALLGNNSTPCQEGGSVFSAHRTLRALTVSQQYASFQD